MAENPTANINMTYEAAADLANATLQQQQQQIEFWLPIPINFQESQLCQIHPSRNLTTRQRTFQPVACLLNDSNEFYPLLVNESENNLTNVEKKLRKVNRFEENYQINIPYRNKNIEIEMKQALQSYGRQWNVHQSILMINLNRLYQLPPEFTLKEYFIQQQKIFKKSYDFSLEEWFLMLEFYLQMDGSCFYMKTCRFRDAIPPHMEQNGIFCIQSPQAKYGMKRCQNKTCRFCYESHYLTHRFEPTIHYSDTQLHRFVNNYEVYLNCNVTCKTSNVIYALTCPCQRFDYIGRCKEMFRDRMRDHQIYGTRLVANSFLGQIIADRLQDDRPRDPKFPDHENRLYEHLTYCPVAIKMFLKGHPDFWCLVPMTKEQVLMDNATLSVDERNRLEEYQSSSIVETTTTTTNPYIRELSLVQWCIKYLPPPPLNYQYSLRQKLEQYEFFRGKKERFVSHFLSLYDAAIVIALPEDASNAVCHVIQALLIVYVEPKLNILITDTDTTATTSDDSMDEIWCKDLIHPRIAGMLT
ncbi:unnamed protein product [Rotaria sordida]|uniref:Uncharacterized protein n=1 Tax=Rotaria sordida TaxID=392033 RepID=A0A814KCT7_9BILA|nr:unnamed protein product [Rotaria sordida]CAF3924347.1 unnamed protein product [Rotaria sordida]